MKGDAPKKCQFDASSCDVNTETGDGVLENGPLACLVHLKVWRGQVDGKRGLHSLWFISEPARRARAHAFFTHSTM